MARKFYNKIFFLKRTATGLGLFTHKKFYKGDFIIEYTGTKITHNVADQKGGRYLFTLNKKWIIDGSERKNLARYINHGCVPNCEAVIEDDAHVMIYAIKKIIPGDELTYDYGTEYFNDFITAAHCRCTSCRQKHSQ